LRIEPYLEANTRIKNHILRKGQQLKQFMNDAIFIPYATLGLACLAKINFNLDKIEKKMQAISRIIFELQKKKQPLPLTTIQ